MRNRDGRYDLWADLMQRAKIHGPLGQPDGPLAVFVRVPSWLFVTSWYPENCEAPLDLGYSATMAVNAGFRTVVLDLETGMFPMDRVIGALSSDPPKVVFLSGITLATGPMLAIAGALRRADANVLIVAVGQQASAVPSAFLFPGSPVDLTTVDEFEETVKDILDAVMNHRSPFVSGTRRIDGQTIVTASPRGQIRDLDLLGRPAHEFFLNRRYRYLHPMQRRGRYRWGFIQGTRGCPFPCIYRSKTLRTSFGASYRARSAESIVDEMSFLQRHGITTMVFTDDHFTLDRERVMTLCSAIRSSGVNITWTAEARVTPADPEMYQAMRSAGCSTISMGVESGSQRILDVLDKRSTVEEAVAAFRMAREAGLLRVGFFMVGSPGETRADFGLTKSLMLKLDPDIIQVANFTTYPGSKAFLQFQDRLSDRWSDYQHYERQLDVAAAPMDETRTWQRELYLTFLRRPDFLERYLRQKGMSLLFNADVESALALATVRSLWSAK